MSLNISRPKTLVIVLLMICNVFQPRMLPTVTRNVTFACTGVARRAPAGACELPGGRGREEKRKETGEEEMVRGSSRSGRDGSRTRCATNAIKIYHFINPDFMSQIHCHT